MKNSALIRIILFGTLTVILCGLLVVFFLAPGEKKSVVTDPPALTTGAADPSSPDGQTENRDETEPAAAYHTASIPAVQVTQVNIDWVAGSITVEPGDTDEIILRETNNPDRPMVWIQEGDKLTVQYADYEFGKLDHISAKNYKKDLTVTVPKGWVGRELEINAAASNVNIRDLQIEEVEIKCVTGVSRLENCAARKVSLATASGDIRFSGSLEKLECSAVSANCTLKLNNTPQKVELSSVSGRLDLTLPEDSGFQVEMEGTRKKLDTDFAVTQNDDVYYCGDGSCIIEVNSVTSRVNIHKG